VVHWTHENLLAAALILAASTAAVPVAISIAWHGPEAVSVEVRLIAWTLLEKALAGLLLMLSLVVGGRLGGLRILGCAVLLGTGVLLPLALIAASPAAAMAALALPL
jgi:hypothetical protein